MQRLRLQLPKRRLYSSFRRRLPKALNFNVYRGGWTDTQRGENEVMLEPRDVELEPLLEPEYVVVRFKPRRNNRRLILTQNGGLPVELRIEDPVPGVPGGCSTPMRFTCFNNSILKIERWPIFCNTAF
jgi:hypothetical protein